MAKMKVRYRGASDVRRITAKELKAAGLESYDGPDLEWSRKNRWTIEEVEMTDGLEEILRGEGTFRLEKINDAGESGGVEADATKTDDTGSQIVMTDTGQVEENKHEANMAKQAADDQANAPQSSGSDTPAGTPDAANSATSTAGTKSAGKK